MEQGGGTLLIWCIPLIGYLWGTVLPADYLVRKIRGASPREFGENLGTAATWRLAGPLPGVLVAIFDVAKGFFPVYLAARSEASPLLLALSAAAPVLGHNWPIQRRFQGGRGLAPCIGALLFLAPLPFLIGFSVGGGVAIRRRRTPWLGYVGIPLGLMLAYPLGTSVERIAAAVSAALFVLLRQFQWGQWS